MGLRKFRNFTVPLCSPQSFLSLSHVGVSAVVALFSSFLALSGSVPVVSSTVCLAHVGPPGLYTMSFVL